MLLFFFLYLVFMCQYGRLNFCQVISHLRNNFIFWFYFVFKKFSCLFGLVICEYYLSKKLFTKEPVLNEHCPQKNRSQMNIVHKRTGPKRTILPTSPQLPHLLYHHQPTKSPYSILLRHSLKLYSPQNTSH